MEKLYDIFRKCYPELNTSFESFRELLPAGGEIIFEDDKGGALVCGENIALLCVLPEYRHRGIGTALLGKCEKLIKENGYRTARLGSGGWFFLGASVSEEEYRALSSPFFEKRGYRITDGCFEMSMKTKDLDEQLIPETSVSAEFRFLDTRDRDELLKAVAAVDEKWVKYFDENDLVFAGIADGKIASFCIVDEDCTTLISDGKNKVGSIGCVGTVPEMRRNGIGLAMVGKAGLYLKENGSDDIYIHYTYLDKWYGKLGFRTLIYFAMGAKEIEN